MKALYISILRQIMAFLLFFLFLSHMNNTRIFLGLIVCLIPISTSAAPALLAPPSLEKVMQQNEALAREIARDKQEQSNISTPVQSSGSTQDDTLPEELTYHLLESGKAISISRAKETDLWVQAIHLDR